MDAANEDSVSHVGRTAFLLAALAALMFAASHIAYQYMLLSEGYVRLVLH